GDSGRWRPRQPGGVRYVSKAGVRRRRSPAELRGLGYRPWFRRAGIVAADGDDRPMDSGSGSTGTARPRGEFSRLLDPGAAIPDVFAFLAAHPAISLADRLDVLLVDQSLRWLRNQPLPLRVYLSAFPDIADRGEMIRALVDGERQARRRSSARLNDTWTEPG